MKLSATRARLEMLTKELLRNWEETTVAWRDAKADEFDQAYLQELRARVNKTSAAIEKLDALLAKVEEDCE